MNRKKNLIALLSILLPSLGLISGLYLTGQNQDIRQEALTTNAYYNYWPMNLNNWWRFKQTNSYIAGRGNCGEGEYTAWWVIPPDLYARGIASRTLSMKKTHPCAWNFVEYPDEIRWHIANPVYFNAANGTASHWWRQWGISRRAETTALISPTDVINNLPYNKNIGSKYFKTSGTHVIASDMRVLNNNTGPQVPYSLFAYKRFDGELLNIDPFYFSCLTDSLQKFVPDKHLDLETCGQLAGLNHNIYGGDRWNTTVQEVVLNPVNYPGLQKLGYGSPLYANKVTYFEVGRGQNQMVDWVACEQWYFAPNVGPVQIDATVFTNAAGAYNNLEATKSRCQQLNFETHFSTNSYPNDVKYMTRVRLDEAGLDLSGNDPYGFDSPAAAANYNYEWLQYFKNGWWWTYSIATGELMQTGRLIDVWGPNGSKAPAVSINSQAVYPYTSSEKMSAVWSPGFISGVMGMTGKFLIFNSGAYFIQNPGATTVWPHYGPASSLLAGFAPYNGVYPFTNNGPDAIDETENINELIIINQGIAWIWNQSGKHGPFALSSIPNYANNAPAIRGIKPLQPQAIVEFKNGSYLSPAVYFPGKTETSSPQLVPNDKQAVIFQQGRTWVNYHNGQWEAYGPDYAQTMPAPASVFYPSPTPTVIPSPTPTKTPAPTPTLLPTPTPTKTPTPTPTLLPTPTPTKTPAPTPTLLPTPTPTKTPTPTMTPEPTTTPIPTPSVTPFPAYIDPDGDRDVDYLDYLTVIKNLWQKYSLFDFNRVVRLFGTKQ
jgi:hypothetical protein